MMLITSLALVGWGSAAAEEVPQVTLVDGYKFVQEWKSEVVPLTETATVKWSDNRQGFGRNNQFYIQDKNSGQKKVHIYDQNGFVSDFHDSGLGSNITMDEAGNVLVRIPQYQRPYTAGNEIRIIKADGSEYKDIALPTNRPQRRGDYWGFAEGDVFSAEGGKLVIVAANIKDLYVVEMKSGELVEAYNVTMPSLFDDPNMAFSADDYVSSWTDAADKKHFIVVHRSENPIDVVLDGTTATVKTINTHAYSNYGTSNGVNCFAMNGKNYIMFTTQPNWNDGFVIAELNTDANGNLDGTVNVVAMHENDYTEPMGSNVSSCNNWLNAEPRDGNSVYVYQYFPGYYMARYIFSTKGTTLADIVNDGEEGESYTIADDILGVYIAENEPNKVYAKDLGKHRDPSVKSEGEIDYVRETAKLQGSDWDQSNWVLLEFDTADEAQKFAGRWYSNFDAPAAKVIKGGTLTGKLTNKLNPTMQVTSYTVPTEPDDEYSVNNYVTCNFMTPNVQTSTAEAHAGKKYFFIEPKAQEFVKVNWATYDGADMFHFSLPEANGTVNAANLKGGFKVNWELYPGDYKTDFIATKIYNFHAIVRYVAAASQGPRRTEGDVVDEGNYVVYPLEGGDNLITAIDGVNVDREVVSVTYVNLMGMQSAEPFVGINLVVTRYNDGTVKTCKLVK